MYKRDRLTETRFVYLFYVHSLVWRLVECMTGRGKFRNTKALRNLSKCKWRLFSVVFSDFTKAFDSVWEEGSQWANMGTHQGVIQELLYMWGMSRRITHMKNVCFVPVCVWERVKRERERGRNTMHEAITKKITLRNMNSHYISVYTSIQFMLVGTPILQAFSITLLSQHTHTHTKRGLRRYSCQDFTLTSIHLYSLIQTLTLTLILI